MRIAAEPSDHQFGGESGVVAAPHIDVALGGAGAGGEGLGNAFPVETSVQQIGQRFRRGCRLGPACLGPDDGVGIHDAAVLVEHQDRIGRSLDDRAE